MHSSAGDPRSIFGKTKRRPHWFAIPVALIMGAAACGDEDPGPTEPGPSATVQVKGAVAEAGTGTGVENATVVGSDAGSDEELFEASTDAKGEYEAEFTVDAGEEPDEVRVEAEAEDYERGEATETFSEEMEVDLELSRAEVVATVTGTVTDQETGEALEDADVTGSDPESDEELFEASTDAEGEYEAEFIVDAGEEPDEVRVEAEAEDYESGEATETFSEEMEVDLELLPVEIGPDLVVEYATASPSTVNAGDTVTVAALVRNHGDATGSKTLYLIVNQELTAAKSVTVEAPDEDEDPVDTQVEAEFSWSPTDPGTYGLAVNSVDAGTVEILDPTSLIDYEQVTRTVDFPAGDFQEVVVECPDNGTVPLSGGFRVMGPAFHEDPETLTRYSHPDGDSDGYRDRWVVGVSNTAEEDREIEAYVVCAQPLKGYEEVAMNVTLDPHEDGPVFAPCSDAEAVAVSGGVQILGAGSPTIIRYGLPEPKVAADGESWRVGIVNASFGETEARVHGTCIHPPDGYDSRDWASSVDAEGYEGLPMECPLEGQVPLGGGFGEMNGQHGNLETRVRSMFPGTISSTQQVWAIGVANRSSDDAYLEGHVRCATRLE